MFHYEVIKDIGFNLQKKANIRKNILHLNYFPLFSIFLRFFSMQNTVLEVLKF